MTGRKLLFLFACLAVLPMWSQDAALSGQASLFYTVQDGTDRFGWRYLPELRAGLPLGDTYRFDLETAANAFGTGDGERPEALWDDADIDPYRLWGRFSHPRWEVRVGLQKINFGAALLLRPLMWFDRIDPRDPQQITEGVDAVLGRYYFLNNGNIWAWGLYGNADPKGWEVFGNRDGSWEWGGRIQWPLGPGEIAATVHFRDGVLALPAPLSTDVVMPERRFGIDGKWDVGVGLWIESVFSTRETPEPAGVSIPLPTRQTWTTVGMDWTVPWGNGLPVVAEHMVATVGTDDDFFFETVHASALMADYSLGLLDRVQAIVFYDWEAQRWARFLAWSRTWDRVQLYLNAFWNSEYGATLALTGGRESAFGAVSRGVQVQLIVNH